VRIAVADHDRKCNLVEQLGQPLGHMFRRQEQTQRVGDLPITTLVLVCGRPAHQYRHVFKAQYALIIHAIKAAHHKQFAILRQVKLGHRDARLASDAHADELVDCQRRKLRVTSFDNQIACGERAFAADWLCVDGFGHQELGLNP